MIRQVKYILSYSGLISINTMLSDHTKQVINSPILSSGILVSCDSLPHMTSYNPTRRFFNSGIVQSRFYNLAISKLVICNHILGFSKFQFCNPAIRFSYYEKDKLLIFS